jgi:hypothetical protein
MAIGLALIVGFCHGNAGFDFAYPVERTKLHVDLATTGLAASMGVLMTAIGAPLLVIAWLIALIWPVGRTKLKIKRRFGSDEKL